MQHNTRAHPCSRSCATREEGHARASTQQVMCHRCRRTRARIHAAGHAPPVQHNTRAHPRSRSCATSAAQHARASTQQVMRHRCSTTRTRIHAAGQSATAPEGCGGGQPVRQREDCSFSPGQWTALPPVCRWCRRCAAGAASAAGVPPVHLVQPVCHRCRRCRRCAAGASGVLPMPAVCCRCRRCSSRSGELSLTRTRRACQGQEHRVHAACKEEHARCMKCMRGRA